MDVDAYRAAGEAFVTELSREHYRHFSGQKAELEIEAIYDAHAALFAPEALDALRSAGNLPLLEFAVEGAIGRATKPQTAELARREAAIELDVEGGALPFRQAPVVQANEPDPARRAALEAARNEAVERELNPLLLEALERSHAVSRELGWPSMAAMCAELAPIDLDALASATQAVLVATDALYEDIVDPCLHEELGYGFERLRRADLPAFFRAPSLDRAFPAARLLPELRATLAALGLQTDGRVRLDAEARRTKSPRAFCAPVRVPDEVYLVIAPHGGRDDYESLLHEAGHAEHYGHVRASLPFEARYLGDNSITEGFAFLFQGLAADREWLRRRLPIEDPGPIERHARASKLIFVRRYAAKLAYELELHGGARARSELHGLYARKLSAAVRVDWPAATWLSDVDAFFYAARYLRAWAFEAQLRRALRERFGAAWFEDLEAGALLRALWSEGQASSVDDLLERIGSAALVGAAADFSALVEELSPAA